MDGKPPPTTEQVAAVNAALARWSALEVTAAVESWMVPALFGRQGKAIKKLSQSMGGVVLKVSDGVCRGRATSVEAAREATRKLEERVSAKPIFNNVSTNFCLVVFYLPHASQDNTPPRPSFQARFGDVTVVAIPNGTFSDGQLSTRSFERRPFRDWLSSCCGVMKL